jgi:hypothetical protein
MPADPAVLAGVADVGGPGPADRAPGVGYLGEVQGAVHGDREAQARPGAELEKADPVFHAVAERDQTHAADLRQASRPGCKGRGVRLSAVKLWQHRRSHPLPVAPGVRCGDDIGRGGRERRDLHESP